MIFKCDVTYQPVNINSLSTIGELNLRKHLPQPKYYYNGDDFSVVVFCACTLHQTMHIYFI